MAGEDGSCLLAVGGAGQLVGEVGGDLLAQLGPPVCGQRRGGLVQVGEVGLRRGVRVGNHAVSSTRVGVVWSVWVDGA